MSYTTCTSGAIVRKAGKNASSIAVASGSLLQDYVDQAEGVICMKTHKDWITNWASVDTYLKPAVTAAVVALAAIDVINYDMSGYTSRTEAQTMIDVLKDEADTIIKDLREKGLQQF